MTDESKKLELFEMTYEHRKGSALGRTQEERTREYHLYIAMLQVMKCLGLAQEYLNWEYEPERKL